MPAIEPSEKSYTDETVEGRVHRQTKSLPAPAPEDLRCCPICGANKRAWRETFGEEHYCYPGTVNSSNDPVYRKA